MKASISVLSRLRAELGFELQSYEYEGKFTASTEALFDYERGRYDQIRAILNLIEEMMMEERQQ